MNLHTDLDGYRTLQLDPEGSPDGAALALGMITTLDGATTLHGRSHGIGGPADRTALQSLRDACDTVLVGAATVRAEGYGSVAATAESRQIRHEQGMRPHPRIAIVTATGDLPAGHPLLQDPDTPGIIITSEQAHHRVHRRLEDLGTLPTCDLIVAGGKHLDGLQIRSELARRGLRRIVCEGGAKLAGLLVQQGAVDEYFVTIAPMIAGGEGRMLHHVDERARPLRLIWAATSGGEMLLRYADRRPLGSRTGGRDTEQSGRPAEAGDGT